MAKSNIHGADLNGFGLLDSLDAALDQPQEEKAAAPAGRKRKGTKIGDLCTKQTYWIENNSIAFIEAYAYTERINIRKAVNRLIRIGIEKIEEDYAATGKELMKPDKEDF